MLPHLRALQPVIQKLSQLQQPVEAIPLARAVWRSLHLLPTLATSWSAGPFYSLMLHPVSASCPLPTLTYLDPTNIHLHEASHGEPLDVISTHF